VKLVEVETARFLVRRLEMSASERDLLHQFGFGGGLPHEILSLLAVLVLPNLSGLILSSLDLDFDVVLLHGCDFPLIQGLGSPQLDCGQLFLAEFEPLLGRSGLAAGLGLRRGGLSANLSAVV
jgi:hypothetical protein